MLNLHTHTEVGEWCMRLTRSGIFRLKLFLMTYMYRFYTCRSTLMISVSHLLALCCIQVCMHIRICANVLTSPYWQHRIKFPSHTNGIQWILGVTRTFVDLKLQQKQWFLLAFSMYDQRQKTGSCCYDIEIHQYDAAARTTIAHTSGLRVGAYMCVLWCSFRSTIGTLADDLILWFDSSVFDEDATFQP